MPDSYDVFLSYAWADEPRVRLLEAALRARGMTVWRDVRNIDSFASITRSIEQGVARSRALVAYYSTTYPTRRACQFELTAAFVAAQSEGDPRRRVLVVNPEVDATHIEPIELRDELYQRAPFNEHDAAPVALAIHRHVARLDGFIGDISLHERPEWFGTQPTGSTRFVGRVRTMWEVHSALHGAGYGPITGDTCAGAGQLRGLAGMGKTLLAEEYALRFGAAYSGGIFWLYALGTDTSDRSREERDALRHRQVEAFVRTLLPGRVTTNLSPEEIEGLLRLEIGRRGPCLWVIDDFPIGASANELRSWLAPHPLARSLLTTRGRDYSALAATIELEALPEADGYDLLTAGRAPREDAEVAAAHLIVDELGGNALALDVAGAALATYASTQSFSDFHRSLNEESSDVLDLAAEFSGELPTGHERSIAVTIGTSIARLSSAARDVARVASHLASSPIPLELVSDAVARVDTVDPIQAADQVERGVSELCMHSLADLAGDADADFEVHTLVARAIRFRERQTPRSAALRAAAVSSVVEALERLEDLEAQPRLIRWTLHGQRLTNTASSHDELELLGLLAHFDYERADYANAETSARRTYLGFEELLGEDDAETQAAKGDLGAVLYASGKLAEAAEIQREVLDTALRLRGELDPSVLIVRGNLAATLAATGDFAGARMHAQIVLDARCQSQGPEHVDTLRARSNLAGIASQQGDYKEARCLAACSLELSLRTLGPNHRQTLQAQHELSHAVFSLGDLHTAKEIQETLLESLRRLRGPTHDETLATQTNLAATLAELGEFEAARKLEETAYTASCDAFGEEHPQTLWIGGNLAMTLWKLGEQEAALTLLRGVVEATTRLLGDGHPDTLGASTNLGELTELAGMADEALTIKQRSYASAVLALGPDHPTTLRIRLSLANTLYGLGRLSDAQVHYHSAARQLKLSLGPEHPDTLRGLGNLARVLYDQGKVAAAAALDELVLDGRRHQLGASHPETLMAEELYKKTSRELETQGQSADKELRDERNRWQSWIAGSSDDT